MGKGRAAVLSLDSHCGHWRTFKVGPELVAPEIEKLGDWELSWVTPG